MNNFVKLRRKIANEYNFNLKNDERFITPSEKDEIYHSYHLYPLRINFSKIKLNKNELIKTFLKKGIKLQVHYIPLHLQPFYKKNAIFKKSYLKNSENFYKQEISLPIYPDLKDNELKHVIKNLLYLK